MEIDDTVIPSYELTKITFERFKARMTLFICLFTGLLCSV